MKTLALRARVFIHCFLVFGYLGETLALVHILLLNHVYFINCASIQFHGHSQQFPGHIGDIAILYEQCFHNNLQRGENCLV
jgi:hypothetical protein